MTKKRRSIPKQRQSKPARAGGNASAPATTQTTQIVAQQFSGPLPPPAVLEHYEDISPGLANRIVAMAEKQSDHRQELEARQIEAQIKETRLGQFLAFGIGTIAILAGVYAAASGAEWVGGFIGAGGVVGLAVVFIQGRKTILRN